MKEKVVLAYSGGLDTTTIIPWLQENYDYDVIAVCINVGQGKETDGLEERALKAGAIKFFLVDVVDELVDDFIIPMVKSGAVYENKYLLGTSIARPVTSKVLAEIALKEGAVAICHGATGKGNDQVRFELTIKAFAPHMKIIAPWRIWDIKSRDDAFNYCHARGIEVPMKKENSYSRDRNIWHMSHEGLDLESPANAPDYDKILHMGVTPEKAPDEATIIDIEFEQGTPVKLNGEAMKASDLLSKLNELGGANGIGLADICENRIVGLKSRGVYETPGGTILYAAHQELEYLCVDKQTMQYKNQIAIKYAELIYSGEWYTPLRAAIQAFVEETQKTVTGNVKLKLYKGNVIPQGATSPYSLHNEDLASFSTGDLYDHKDAEGFITLLGLPLKVRALINENESK